jgi:uncharacterized repeat protein (TIGR03803 family)
MTYLKAIGSNIVRSNRLKSLPARKAVLLTTLALIAAAVTTAATAQTYTTLHSFDGADGFRPFAELVQGIDGRLYGTTSSYGAPSPGTVFKMNASGTLTTLHNFDFTDGSYTYAGLVQAVDGNLYGAATQGGIGGGTVFKITPSGTLTTLYTFCSQSSCVDGAYPYQALIQATDGNFYGTTNGGGGTNFGGTVFKITPDGVLATLHTFCAQSGCPDGIYPQSALVEGTDGNFYGTTSGDGGRTSGGTVFKITPSGTLTTLYRFCAQTSCAHGNELYAGLVQGSDGNFYGTTRFGGAQGWGTVFKITPTGMLTTLHSFCSRNLCADGGEPHAALVRGTDGNFYGTTFLGGANNSCSLGGCGTIFRLTPSGKLTTLYSFCPQIDCADGEYPWGAVVQHTNGNFYGTAAYGGPDGDGTAFQLSLGLGPFVSLVSTSGKVGTPIKILGQGLTGTTAVSFNGTPATFKVWADTYLAATVPSGATSGPVAVTTPTGTLTSNQEFRIHPVIISVAPASGAAGTPVVITGTSFTQTTKVIFGGGKTAAIFTVDSDTQVTATVPAGAPTGYIVLSTAGGRSRSPDTFAVTPSAEQ